MKRFSTRDHDVVYLLFTKSEGYTILELARIFEISHNTMTKILNEMEERLPLSWKLERDNKGIIKLNVPPGTNLEEAWSSIDQDNLYLQLLDYIFVTGDCTNERLIDHFNISRTTLYRRTSDLKGWLEEFDVELQTKPFYHLTGDEKNIRRCMMQYYDIYFSYDLYEIDWLHVKDFESELKQQFEQYNIVVRSSSLRNLTIYLYVFHIRVNFRRLIEKDLLVNTQQDTIEFKITKSLHSFFPKQLTRNELQSELSYFSLLLLSEFSPESLTNTVLMMRRNRHEEYRYRWIFDLLNQLSEHFYFRFDQDDQLLFDLEYFARTELIQFQLLSSLPTTQFIQYVNYYENDPLLLLIKKVVNQLSPKYSEHYEMSPAALLELSLFIQAAILRKKNQLKNRVLFVYRLQAEKSLLTELLLHKLGNRMELRYVDLTYLQSAKGFADFDYIISTEPIDPQTIRHIPVLTVSSVMTNSELAYIGHMLDKTIYHRLTDELELLTFLSPFQE